MPRTNVCVYRNCGSVQSRDKNLTFHRFPKDVMTQQKWVELCQKKKLEGLSSTQLANYRVCSRHFLPEDFQSYGNQGKRRIKDLSIPINEILGSTLQAKNLPEASRLGFHSERTEHVVQLSQSFLPISVSANPIPQDNKTDTHSGISRLDFLQQLPEQAVPIVHNSQSFLPNTVSVKPISQDDKTDRIPGISGLDLLQQHPEGAEPVDHHPQSFIPIDNSRNPGSQEDNIDTLPGISKLDFLQQQISANLCTVTHNRFEKLPVVPLPVVRNPCAPRQKVFKPVTPKEAQQARLIQSLRKEIKVTKQKIKRMEAAAKTNADLIKFAKSIDKLQSSQKAFIQTQIDHQKRRPWSEAEKQFALALYYISPAAYKYLRNKVHFALPCITKIRQWINELNLTTGISQGIFDKLETKVESMTENERQCVLMWDEVSLKRQLDYNAKMDLVEGFQDLGELGRTNKMANYALTFMIRGLKYSWKQPIAYVLSHSTVCNQNLKALILQVLDKLFSIGLHVRVMVCDQGSPNRAAAASLGVTEGRPYIERGSHKIYFLFDIPHLIKSVRNNLLANDFEIDGETISWQVIVELRKVESQKASRAAPKLTDRHVYPDRFQRMTVSLATQVFSASVSAAINAGLHTGDLQNPNCGATANFCKRVNDIFDCLNSRRPTSPNPLNRPLDSTQPQVEEYLTFSIDWIKKWKVKNRESPPCFAGLIMTINGVLQLWNDMRASGSLYLMTNNLNQDPLENLYAIIRSRGGCNLRPSASIFRRNLQYAMTAHLMKPSAGTNCEADDLTALLPMLESIERTHGLDEIGWRKKIDVWVGQDASIAGETVVRDEQFDEAGDFAAESCSQVEIDDLIVDEPVAIGSLEKNVIDDELTENLAPMTIESAAGWEIDEEPIDEDEDHLGDVDNRIEVASKLDLETFLEGCTLEKCAMKYVAGYLAYKCQNKFRCEDCELSLTRDNQNMEQTDELLIFWKAYKCKEDNELGNLKVPSELLNKVTITMYSIFTETFKSEPQRRNLREHLETCIYAALSKHHSDFWPIEGRCHDHRKYVVSLFVRVHVYSNLKWISRDIRDQRNRPENHKKRKVCTGVKPSAKLQKVSHQ